MAGKKGSTQFAVSRPKNDCPARARLPAICAAFAGLEPQLSNHIVLPEGARYRSGPDSAAAFREDRL
jgi:hypothetical protein